MSNNYQFQVNYTLSWDKSDDDNERDPFTYRYIRYDNLDAEYGYSDRDQRHRLNAVLLWLAPGRVNVNLRYAYRSAQPLSLSAAGTESQTVFGPGSDRIRADGTIVERNTGRKENEYSSLDLRLAREFALSKRVSIEPILEVFNLFGSKNYKQPSYQNLVFNFDGTIAQRPRRPAPDAARRTADLVTPMGPARGAGPISSVNRSVGWFLWFRPPFRLPGSASPLRLGRPELSPTLSTSCPTLSRSRPG